MGKIKGNPNAAAASNVVGMPDRCTADECKKPASRMTFCAEHYTWYKEGLIDKDGHRPKDFDKKYQNFIHRKVA